MSNLKLRPGDQILASKWNGIVDRLPSTRQGNPAGSRLLNRVEVRVKNDTANNRDIGEVMAISSFDGPTGSVIFEILDNAVYKCVSPVWHTSIARLVILAEPIPAGEIGIAVLSGHCIVSLTSGADTDQFVMIDPSSLNKCKGTTSGIGRLLAKLSGGNYGLINFRDECTLWRYELTQASQAPAVTTAKLVDQAGNTFHTTMNLSDPLSLMDDQVTGDKGWCFQCGNLFQAIQGPCL